jgi:hypothetical protein
MSGGAFVVVGVELATDVVLAAGSVVTARVGRLVPTATAGELGVKEPKRARLAATTRPNAK